MKKITALALAALMLLTLGACGSKSTSQTGSSSNTGAASSDLEYIQNKGTMIIGITEYEPMNFKKDDEWTGFDTEFAKLVCEKLGVKPEFLIIDWDNKIPEIDSKAIDCVWNGMTLTNEVTSSMACTNPYVINAQVVVMNKDKVGEYKDTASLKDLKLTAESGSAGEKAIEEAGLKSTCTAVTTQSDALMEVASGSADACVIDNTMANAMTGDGTSYKDLAPGISLTEEKYGIGFRKGSDVAEKVNSIIDELKADGSLQKLAEKYELTLAD